MIAVAIRYDDRRLKDMLARHPVEMRAAIMVGLRRAGNLIADRAKLAAPGRFGVLRASIGVVLDEANLTAWVGALLNAKGTGSDEGPRSYAWFVEHGRAAGRMPPPSSLQLWAKRYAHGEFDERRTALLIARSIGKKGTKPAPFLAPAVEAEQENAYKLIQREVDAAIARLEGGS